MNANIIKLHIQKVEKSFEHNGRKYDLVDFQVIATSSNGTAHPLSDLTNQRGAKSILTRQVKRLGMTKSKDGFSAWVPQ